MNSTTKKIRIAIQKDGRLHDETIKFLKLKGITFTKESKREIITTSDDEKYEILSVRHADIPKYIETGVAQYGIVGQNLIYEKEFKVNILQDLKCCICKLVIAVPEKSKIKKIKDLEGQRIATSYPNSLKKFLKKNKIQASIIKIEGSVEACPELGMSDSICDITQSGNSLKENKLRVLAEVYVTTAVLIGSDDLKKNTKLFNS